MNSSPISVPADISSAAFFLVAGSIAKNADITLKHVGINPTRTGVIDILQLMGADINGENNSDNLPLEIKGRKLKSISYKLPVASAQVKSAIILAGMFAEGETEIIEPQKTRDHTERMLSHLGSPLKTSNNSIFVKPVDVLNASELNVPSDISSAAFFIVAALINRGSEIVLRNIGLNSARTGILDILIRMGAAIEVGDRLQSVGSTTLILLPFSDSATTCCRCTTARIL